MSRSDPALGQIKPFVCSITKNKACRTALYSVHGFWSTDYVRVSQYASWRNPEEWDEPELNWSIGGADMEQEPNRIFAAECFAAAIKDAAELAFQWKGGKQ